MPALLAETGVRSGGRDRHRHRLHVVHDAPDDARRHAALPASRIFGAEPHAWVKLWKHHAAQPEADLINEVAAERGEPWLWRYGGKISSEWFFAKSLQILREAPEVYDRADRLIEAADWIVWQLSGVETRCSCTAGYKAMWSKEDGFPPDAYFAALDPRFEHVIDEKMSRDLVSLGDRAGGLSEQAAAWTGLVAGTPVAVANVDAHVSAPAAGVTRAGTMVMVMGTSICHILLGERMARVEGMCGVVEDGVVPGLFGFEAGQSAVGDIFAWFADTSVPPEVHDEARRRGMPVLDVLEEQAARAAPGRERPSRARLVERQPLGARGRRSARSARRHDARDAARRDLPGVDRGDRLRHARDHRRLRDERRAGHRARRLRRPARAEQAADPDLRRRHGPGDQRGRVAADARTRRGDLRRGRCRRGGRRLRVDRVRRPRR